MTIIKKKEEICEITNSQSKRERKGVTFLSLPLHFLPPPLACLPLLQKCFCFFFHFLISFSAASSNFCLQLNPIFSKDFKIFTIFFLSFINISYLTNNCWPIFPHLRIFILHLSRRCSVVMTKTIPQIIKYSINI